MPFPAVQHVITNSTVEPVIVAVTLQYIIVSGTDKTFDSLKCIAFSIFTPCYAIMQTHFHTRVCIPVSRKIISISHL